MKFKPLQLSADFDPLKLPRSVIRELEDRSMRELERDVIPRDAGSEPSSVTANQPVANPGRRPAYPKTSSLRTKKSAPRAPSIPQPPRDPDRLRSDEERLLHLYESRPMAMILIARVLSWTASKISRIARRVVNAGIWDQGSTFAHNSKTYLLTDRGRRYCQGYGIRSQADKSGNDRVHQVVANSSVCCIEQWFRDQYPEVELEVRIKGTAYQVSDSRQVEPDRLIIMPAGMRIALQVGYRHAPGAEAENLCLLASMPGTRAPDYCLFVACSVAHLQAVAQNVNQQLDKPHRGQDPERVRDKIRMTHIDELLARRFDLSFMLRQS